MRYDATENSKKLALEPCSSIERLYCANLDCAIVLVNLTEKVAGLFYGIDDSVR